MSGHIEKVKELVKNIDKEIVQYTERIIKSGAIDIESYNQDEYRLAKLLFITALEEIADRYKPTHKPELMKELKNLKRV